MSALRGALAAAFLLLSAVSGAEAVEPDEMLADPMLEARARAVSRELRCVVCQNQSIDDSNAPLAHDMRLLVRERIAAGDSDRAVKDYLVKRYGNYVLLKPPMQPNTLFLWFGPLVFLAAAALGFAVYLARARKAAVAEPDALTEDERRRLEERASGTAP
ncbi:MAG: cytochrome c-type biogenesis protein [Pseudomonadota bacterium]